MSTEQRCPRRDDLGGGGDIFPGPDHWHDAPGQRTCSHCGSLHPDDFMAMAQRGVQLGPTDKNYKVYTEEGPLSGRGKFYFQHLDEDNQRAFLSLLQEGSLNIGDPGYFYRLPFFIQRVANGETTP